MRVYPPVLSGYFFASNQIKCLFVIVLYFLHIKFSSHLLKMSFILPCERSFSFHSISIKCFDSFIIEFNDLSYFFLSYLFFCSIFIVFLFKYSFVTKKKIKNKKKLWSFWIALTLINQSSLLSSVSCVCVNQFHTDMMAMPIMVETQRLHR